MTKAKMIKLLEIYHSIIDSCNYTSEEKDMVKQNMKILLEMLK